MTIKEYYVYHYVNKSKVMARKVLLSSSIEWSARHMTSITAESNQLKNRIPVIPQTLIVIFQKSLSKCSVG